MHFYSHLQFFDAHTRTRICLFGFFDECKQSWKIKQHQWKTLNGKYLGLCLGGWWMNHNKTTGKKPNGTFRLVRCFNRFSFFFSFSLPILFHFDFGFTMKNQSIGLRWEWKIERKRREKPTLAAHTKKKQIKFVGSWKLKLFQIVYPHLDLPNALELSVTATQCLHKLNGRNWSECVCASGSQQYYSERRKKAKIKLK